MKKREYKIETKNPKYFKPMCTSLVLIFIFMMSGCATTYTLDLADRKSSPSISHTNLNISKVRSAVEQENGDISVCVELYEPPKTNKSECYAITLPNPSLLKETIDMETLGFRGKDIGGLPDRYAPDTYITDYLYSLEKAKKGCQELEPKKLLADSTLPIVKLTLPEKDSDRLYTLLNKLKAQGSAKEKLYEVKFLKNEADSSAEMNENEVTNYSDVLLIYWPSESDQDTVQPLGIAGGYESEDESTKLYYLLIPPAVLLDLILLGLSGGRV